MLNSHVSDVEEPSFRRIPLSVATCFDAMDLLAHLQMQQMALAQRCQAVPMSPISPTAPMLPGLRMGLPVIPFFCPSLFTGLPYLTSPQAAPRALLTPPSSGTSSGSIGSTPDSQSSTPRTVPGRRAMTFCKLCNKNIAEKKRSQGPTRHVLKDHMKEIQMYKCPHCSYFSPYDATQVVSHIRRNHSGKKADISVVIDNKKEFRDAIDAKIRECFGRGLHDAKLKGISTPVPRKSVEKEEPDEVDVVTV
ncbi:hypothetical protein L596_028360 [Steinernema carpocapsae]|uniref:Uncharacterized protein n=1 Tax=Steinernema carpocapsae TaxID=34508 RepID=A0A4U5LY98_STECR|nr:hypothetical protein L596_028360 [Steinernema carpocapsae]